MTATPSPGASLGHGHPEVCLLADEAPCVNAAPEAVELADRHAWLIARALDRLGAWWPQEVDLPGLRDVAYRAFIEAAALAPTPEGLPEYALNRIEQTLRSRLRSSPWYARARDGRFEALHAAWRGALLAGRPPTDHLLSTRLHLSPVALRERFLEGALVFAIDPARLLPATCELAPVLADAITELPADQQLAAALYLEECLTFDEVGSVMAIPAIDAQELFGRAAMAILARARLWTWEARRVSA